LYPKLLGTEEARRVASATHDLLEFLYQLAREQRWNREFREPIGRVAYHAPCHLRAQNVGLRAPALLRAAGADVTLVEACSGVDGTWGMQARFHDASLGVARGMLDAIRAADAEHVATDCPLAALRIEEGLGRKPVHPVVLLRRAYGGAQA
jgi:glycerol-3-phosphate dehydrogenase subunit C